MALLLVATAGTVVDARQKQHSTDAGAVAAMEVCWSDSTGSIEELYRFSCRNSGSPDFGSSSSS